MEDRWLGACSQMQLLSCRVQSTPPRPTPPDGAQVAAGGQRGPRLQGAEAAAARWAVRARHGSPAFGAPLPACLVVGCCWAPAAADTLPRHYRCHFTPLYYMHCHSTAGVYNVTCWSWQSRGDRRYRRGRGREPQQQLNKH